MATKPGTLDNPIVVKSFGDEQYAGCTGYPADSHVTIWLTVRPIPSFPHNKIQSSNTYVSFYRCPATAQSNAVLNAAMS